MKQTKQIITTVHVLFFSSETFKFIDFYRTDRVVKVDATGSILSLVAMDGKLIDSLVLILLCFLIVALLQVSDDIQ
jgi:hypothetical protein